MADNESIPVGEEAIKVLIVDDHALFRRGIAMVLEQEKDIELVGEAGDGAEAVQIVTQTTSAYRPALSYARSSSTVPSRACRAGPRSPRA